jgi:hypothetical protein
MPKTTEITCDRCGHDLRETGNSIAYRLALTVERVPSAGGFVTDMMVYPPMKRDAYFCHLRCLRDWLTEQFT